MVLGQTGATTPTPRSKPSVRVDLSNQKKVLALALPIMLSNATVPLVGIVDTAVMGRMESPAFLSAVAVGAVLFSGIFWVFGFLKMGTGGLVAQALGANDDRSQQATMLRACAIAVVFSSLLMLLQTPLLWLGLWAMDGSQQLHSLIADYFYVRMWGAPATLVSFAVMGVLTGQQRMRELFIVQLILNLLNVVLNLGFFHFTDWHVKGVATATVISEYVALGFGLWLIRSLWWVPLTRYASALKDTRAFIDFFTLSGNLFIRTALLTFAFYWITVVSSRLGDSSLALNAILIQMLHLTAYALDGFSIAAGALTGHALGARNRQALWRDTKACTWGALVLASLFTAVYVFGGQLFVDAMTTLPQIRSLAPEYLIWIVLGPLIGVWSFLFDGIFSGTTHTKEMRDGMLISVGIFVLCTELLVPLWGNHGLWLSYHLLMVARALTLGIWFPRILRAAESAVPSAAPTPHSS